MHRFQQSYKRSQVQISMFSKLRVGCKSNLQKELHKILSKKTYNFVRSVDNKMENRWVTIWSWKYLVETLLSKLIWGLRRKNRVDFMLKDDVQRKSKSEFIIDSTKVVSTHFANKMKLLSPLSMQHKQ